MTLLTEHSTNEHRRILVRRLSKIKITGRVHSVETCGTVDGPGIRYVLFLQGCPLRCLYCHNPDTWSPKGGKEYDSDEIVRDIVKYKKYMKLSGGGVTITGGEPMMQINFVSDLIDKIKAEDIHVAIDTSGFYASDNALKVIEKSDLVLIDIKSFDSIAYKKLTGVSLEPTLKTLTHLKKRI